MMILAGCHSLSTVKLYQLPRTEGSLQSNESHPIRFWHYIIDKLLMMRCVDISVDLSDPTWGNYAKLQVMGVMLLQVLRL